MIGSRSTAVVPALYRLTPSSCVTPVMVLALLNDIFMNVVSPKPDVLRSVFWSTFSDPIVNPLTVPPPEEKKLAIVFWLALKLKLPV